MHAEYDQWRVEEEREQVYEAYPQVGLTLYSRVHSTPFLPRGSSFLPSSHPQHLALATVRSMEYKMICPYKFSHCTPSQTRYATKMDHYDMLSRTSFSRQQSLQYTCTFKTLVIT